MPEVNQEKINQKEKAIKALDSVLDAKAEEIEAQFKKFEN